MTRWHHPQLGPVDVIPLRNQPKKVWKHYFDPGEHWERLAPVDPREHLAEVEALVGARRAERRELPAIPPDRREAAKLRLRELHDRAYAVVYEGEMLAESTRWAPANDGSGCTLGLSSHAVFIVVESGQHRKIVTAYRPHPMVKIVDFSEQFLFAHAEKCFRRKTGMPATSDDKELAARLAHATAHIPTSLQDLWHLASTLGEARERGGADIAPALAAAQQTLAAVSTDLKRDLLERFEWNDVLNRLAAAMKDDDRELLVEALDEGEELVEAAVGLGAVEVAERFVEAASELLAWVPAHWAYLAVAADARSASSAPEGLVFRLWSAVAEAVAAAAVREAAPGAAEASLVDELVPASATPDLLSDVRALAERGKDALRSLARQIAAGMELFSPAPAMGAFPRKERPWELHGERPPSGTWRMFVLDAETPHGEEIMPEDWRDRTTNLWNVPEHVGAVHVIVFTASAPLAGASLEDVLGEARSREDVAVTAQRLSRSR